jgi:hypothetical protein
MEERERRYFEELRAASDALRVFVEDLHLMTYEQSGKRVSDAIDELLCAVNALICEEQLGLVRKAPEQRLQEREDDNVPRGTWLRK